MNDKLINAKNAIYLRRRKKVLVQKGEGRTEDAVLATMLKNIESLGFTFSPALLEQLGTLDEAQITEFYGHTVDCLRKMVGANREFAPMYPNFPKQVMDMSEAELYFNAIMHYTGDLLGVRILPNYEKKKRPPLADKLKLKVIDLGTEEELTSLCAKLIGANSSISDGDKADVSWFIKRYKDNLEAVLPAEIPFKENLSYVTMLLMKYTDSAELVLTRYFKTATDVLRLAVALSDGDVSLAKADKFKSFKRSERRLMLSLIERIKNPKEDMLRYKKRWLRLGERLHPGEFKKRFPKTADAFDALRKNKPISTFNSQVEAAIRDEKIADALDLLQKRPGELARRLDHFIRLSKEPSEVSAIFAGVAAKVSTPVLLQVMAHFRARNTEKEVRAFFPKGRVAKVVSIENELPKIDSEVCAHIVRICEETLIERFKERDSLGKTYLDPALGNYLVPFSQRSASKALRTIVRGSKLDIPEGDTIRFFLWWKEGEVNGKKTGRVDIDLSSVMYDKDWNYKEHISYTNLKSSNYKAAHSGDITSAPNGACEFIDLDIPSVLKHGGRYIVMAVNSFTGQPFVTIPECYAGWMMRQAPGSGEIFEPATVVDKIDLGSETKVCIPVILDLEERKIIWTDIGLKSHPNYAINIESNKRGLVHMGKAISTLIKPDLKMLFELHVRARGSLVDNPEEAETVFSEHDGITPFHLEEILADYL